MPRDVQKLSTPLNAASFDYGILTNSVRHEVQMETAALRKMIRKSGEQAIQIGLRLKVVHDALGRSAFQTWLHAEFSWSQSTASRYMAAAKFFGSLERFDLIPPGALFLLARRRVPPEARKEATRQALGGVFVSKAVAQAIIDKFEPPQIASNRLPGVSRIRKQLTRGFRQLPLNEAEELLQLLLSQIRSGDWPG